MDKPALIAQIVAHLDAELLRYEKAARVAQAEATDEQSKAENKYDTRGLESSYLAHGQSRQMLETAQAREQFMTLVPREFAPDEPIGNGALIELESASERLWYFLGPAAGGTEIIVGDREIMVITARSPLGRLLIDKRRGDTVETGEGRARLRYRVTAVS